jgi:DnaJ family protein C protein 22
MSKNVWLAYLFWFIGGWFGLHHFYLGRDRQAFVWWCLLAGYGGVGWFSDFFKISRYVAEANFDDEYCEMLTEKMKKHPKPKFSLFRFAGQIVFGNLLAWITYAALPEEETLFGFSFMWLSFLLVPVAAAIGVHVVGNIGREEGDLKPALIGAFIPGVLYTFDNPRYYFSSFIATCFFRYKVRWNKKPPVRRNLCKRLAILGTCTLLYSSLWASYLYFNLNITNEHGETIKFRESIDNLLKSPLWKQFTESLGSLYMYYKVHGWHQFYDEVMKTLDPLGERNALSVLDLPRSASQQDITKRWRELSKLYHPDKFTDPDEKRAAQEKFMEIKEAYDKISQINQRRKGRSSRSQG